MASIIEDNFKDLKASLVTKQGSKAKLCIGNVLRFFKGQVSSTEIDLALSIILNEDEGIISFIKNHISEGYLQDAIKISLDLLLLLVQELPIKIREHVKEISKVSIKTLNIGKMAKEKSIALQILATIIDNKDIVHLLDINYIISQMMHNLEYGKQSSLVYEQLFPLLGLLARDYPFEMRDYVARVQVLLSSEFDIQTKNLINMKLRIVHGILSAFENIYCTFAPDPEVDKEDCANLYNMLKTMSYPGEIKFRPAFRAALSLLTMHGHLVSEHLYKDFMWWHNTLQGWLKLSWEDIKIAIPAIEVFHREVAKVLLIKQELKVLHFFIDFFKKQLQNVSLKTYELRIVIRGFGTFAPCCSMLLTQEDIIPLYNVVVQRTELMYISETQHKSIQNLPEYIESLSSIISYMPFINNVHLKALQNLIVILFKEFHQLSESLHDLCIKSLVNAFLNLTKMNGCFYEEVLEVTLYQGIIWTCSHPVVIETFEEDKNSVSYKNFLPLWRGLLSQESEAKEELSIRIYDNVIIGFFSIIKKLDLSTKPMSNKNNEHIIACDLKSRLVPNTPKDYHIFINLVDFYKELVNINFETFEKWIPMYLKEVIYQTYKFPIASGFYKLLSYALDFCDICEYFENYIESEEKTSCYILVLNFLQDCIVNIQSFDGDLQVSCLHVLLTAPSIFIPEILTDASVSLQIIFKLGYSYIPLATLAFQTLERWTDNLSEQQTSVMLEKVLPYIEPYLQCQRLSGDLDVDVRLVEDSGRGNEKRVKKKIIEGTPSDLALLQRQIIKFLGKLSTKSCALLISQNVMSQYDHLTSWDLKQQLNFRIPGQDIKPLIYLDKILPRIIQLVLDSNDRQTRVAACELLHGIVLYLLGTSMQVHTYTHIYSHLFPCLLQLASDADLVVNQLFDPLMIQITHWLSSQWKIKSVETALLIDNLMEGVSDEKSNAVRDISAKYLQEFVKWLIRQADPTDPTSSSKNLEALIKKICDFCINSSVYKQLGAALSFNSLYMIFRECDNILDRYWLELSTYFVQSLIANKDQTNIQQIVEALNHIIRVFVDKSDLFNKDSAHRNVPTALNGGLLKHFVLWLFKQTSCVENHCRAKCMEMFVILFVLIDGVTDIETLISQNPEEFSVSALIRIGESININGLNCKPTLDHLKHSEFSSNDVFVWMKNLYASLDFYIWIFRNNFFSPILLFSSQSKSNLFKAIQYFVQNLANVNINELQQVLEATDSENASIKDKEEYTKFIYNILMKILSFVSQILISSVDKISCKQLVLNFFWPDNLTNILVTCLLNPQALNFNVENNYISKKYLTNLLEFIEIIKTYFPDTLYPQIESLIVTKLDEHSDKYFKEITIDYDLKKISVDQNNFITAIWTIRKYSIITNSKFWSRLVNTEIIVNLFTGLIEDNLDNKIAIFPEQKVVSYYKMILSIIFEYIDCKNLMISLTLDDTNIVGPIRESRFTHGQHFCAIFSSTVWEYLLKFPEDLLKSYVQNLAVASALKKHIIVDCFIHIILYIYRNGRTNKELARKVCNILLNDWKEIVIHITELDAVDLMTYLGMIATEPLTTAVLKASGLSEWCMNLLVHSTMSLNTKAKILGVLPFITGPQDSENSDLSEALRSFQSLHFPLESKEFPEGSIERSSYVSAFSAMLNSLFKSQSPVLLERIIAIIAADLNHICEDEIQEKLCKTMESCATENQLKLLLIPYNQIKSKKYSPFIRISILKRVLGTILKSSHQEIIEIFYKKFFEDDFTNLIESPYTSATRRWDLQQAYVDRILCFHLIMILVYISEPSMLSNASNPILKSFPDFKESNSKEVLSTLTKKAFKARTFMNYDEENKESVELFRQYQCTAYKTLCAITCNTKTDMKFYTVFLFRENLSKREIIWKNIIDCKTTYHFPQEFEDYPKTRKHLLEIRKTVIDESPAPNYITQESIFSSSLSQDITEFDMTHAVVRRQVADVGPKSDNLASVIYLTEDLLNQHECMGMICGVIGHMVAKGISPLPLNEVGSSQQKDNSPPTMPSWMSAIVQTLGNAETPVNIRLFIIRVIDNCQAVFKPYAHHILVPVLEVLVDNCAGTTINSFIAETIALLLSWHDIAIPSSSSIQRNLASQFMCFLMKNAYHERRAIYKLNMDIIKSVIEVWKPCLEFPLQYLYNIIRNPVKDTKINMGLELAGVLLANKIFPFSNSNKTDFYNALAMNFNSSDVSNYKPCSEVIGMILNLTLIASEENVLLDSVNKRLDYLRRNHPDIFITCLYGISKHYSDIADRYVTFIIFHASQAVDVHKLMLLQILLAVLEKKGEEFFTDIQTLDFDLLLKDRQVIVLTLKIINKILPFLQNNLQRTLSLIELVKRLVNYEDVVCRQIVYDIAILSFTTIKAKAGWEKVLQHVQYILLMGLLDGDPSLNNHIMEFWKADGVLPKTLDAVFIFIMKNLYDAYLEKNFLQYAITILLQVASQSIDAKRNIFEHPLSECTFKTYNIQDNWRFQNSSIIPLFAETFIPPAKSKQSSNRSNQIYIGSQTAAAFYKSQMVKVPMIQATLDQYLQFEPTVATDVTQTLDESYGTLNYFTFRLDDQEGKLPLENQQVNDVFSKLRRKLLKDKDKTSKQFATRAIAKKKSEKRNLTIKSRIKASKVTMYRQYRTGDFPDIQISSTEILLPLQELSKRDSCVGRIVLYSIYTGIIAELETESRNLFIKEVNMCIENILKKSQFCDAGTMSAIFEIALEYPNTIDIEPDVVSLVSHTSQLLSLGALFLESKLNDEFLDTERTNKRSTNRNNNEYNHWLKLAGIYKSMSDYDTTQGIFTNALECNEDYVLGLELEYGGDYYEAMKCYEKVLLGTSGLTNEIEIQNHKESYFNSLAKLGQWDDLNQGIKGQVDSLDDMWNKSWIQDKLFPLFISSEIHKIINNDESNDFAILINEWLSDPDKATYLKTNFSEELSMYNIINGNLFGGAYYMEQKLTMFLKDWSTVNLFSNELRLTMLMDIQKTSEIQMFISTTKKNDNLEYAAVIRRLIKTWLNNVTKPSDSLLIWESKLGYRTIFSNYIKKQLNALPPDFAFIKDELDDCKTRMELSFLNATLKQKNIGLSRKYIRKLKYLGEHEDPEKNYTWKIARCQQIFVQAYLETDIPKKIEDCFRSWRMLESLMKIDDLKYYPEQFIDIRHSIVDITIVLRNLIYENPNILDNFQSTRKFILVHGQNKETSELKILDGIGFKSLDKAIDYAEAVHKNSSINMEITTLVECYKRIIQFSMHNLKYAEDDFKNVYILSLIQSILKAMALGSIEAMQFFPILLQYEQISAEMKAIFNELSSLVPEWMFIQWAPQLLAQLTGNRSEAIGPLVIRLAETYPDALHYPFRLSILNYKYQSGSYAEWCVAKLKQELMKNPLIDTFIEAMTCVCLPETMIATALEKFKEAFHEDKKARVSVVDSIKRQLFHPHLHKLRGKVFGVLAKFEKIFCHYMENPTPSVMAQIKRMLKTLSESRPKTLQDLCPWLADFKGHEDMVLEIPGQYHGRKKPLPQYHIRIEKFDSKINIQISQRMPVKITILGNDAKEHIYLIKYGEDLRLDQRIQQIFTLMNEQLSLNPDCSFRRLSILTYNVIPLATDLGMIQWISKTKSLREMFYSTVDQVATQKLKEIFNQYSNWIRGASETEPSSFAILYGNAVTNYSRNAVIAKYQELVNKVPKNILKDAFKYMSSNAESFFTLRHNFATSYGVMCIAHWILGIGDRHLSNCLISTNSGFVVGIDFNCAFGSGVQLLPIPELVPIRLTPHIMKLMEPTANFGLIPRVMVHTLRAFRNVKSILHATMDIFMHEPLINWIEPIKIYEGQSDESDIFNYTDTSMPSVENEQTMAHLKLRMAHLKLKGSNPVHVLQTELKYSYISKLNEVFLKKYIERVMGVEQDNIRCRLNMNNLTAKEQVDCLIDLATDRSILGCTWSGWEPWM